LYGVRKRYGNSLADRLRRLLIVEVETQGETDAVDLIIGVKPVPKAPFLSGALHPWLDWQQTTSTPWLPL
jgi:hypothetical protein